MEEMPLHSSTFNLPFKKFLLLNLGFFKHFFTLVMIQLAKEVTAGKPIGRRVFVLAKWCEVRVREPWSIFKRDEGNDGIFKTLISNIQRLNAQDGHNKFHLLHFDCLKMRRLNDYCNKIIAFIVNCPNYQ